MQLNPYGRLPSFSLNFSGICNLDCVYCFNPKVSQATQETNKRIRDAIENDKYIEEIDAQVTPEEVRNVSFWGGEPTLNLPLFTERMRSWMEHYPNLDSFSFSTNLSAKKLADHIIAFVHKLADLSTEFNRKMHFELQISLDGPAEINDINRGIGTTKKIIENIEYLYSSIDWAKIQSSPLEVAIHGKPTLVENNWRNLANEKSIKRIFSFYNDLYSKIDAVKPNWLPLPMFHILTYAFPGNYTSEQGKKLGKFLITLFNAEEKIRSEFKYVDIIYEQIYLHLHRWLRLILRLDKLEIRDELALTTICSAGRSLTGLDSNSKRHVCQGSFFFEKEAVSYIDSHGLKNEFSEVYGYPFENYRNFVEGRYVVDAKDQLQVARFNYLLGANQYPSFRFSVNRIFVNELYAQGQIDKEFYSKESNRILLASFGAYNGFLCQSNSAFSFGLAFIGTPDIFRLLGNGVFQAVLKKAMKEHKGLENWLKAKAKELN